MDIQTIDKIKNKALSKAKRSILSEIKKGYAVPQLVIQYTTYCNASCPQCGMRRGSNITRITLDKEYVKLIIDYAVLEWGVQFLSFTGGEPFLFIDDIIELINYASRLGAKYIRTGTNGFAFRYNQSNINEFEKRVHNIAEKISETKLYTLWISIDSANPNTHEKMRGFQSLIKGIEKSIPIFERYGIYPAANLGLNRNIGGEYNSDEVLSLDKNKFYEKYRKGISDFYQMAINMGFTIANICYPMSVENGTSAYHATSKDYIVSFSNEEKALLFKALYDSATEFRSKIRIFTPRSSLQSLIDFYSEGKQTDYPCRGGIDYFYIDALNGHVYPCGYRAEDDLGEIWDIDINELRKQKPNCIRCDWECFRDPTEIIQPIINLFHSPTPTLVKLITEKKRRLWIKDLLYFYACDFFNSRSKPNYTKMKIFAH